MGSLILCHKKKARQPYEITRIHRKIYTIEELCYYLCNHLYLLDHTIVNDVLCDWLENELEMKTLAEDLRALLKQNSSVEQFVITILANSSIYTTAELNFIQSILDRLKNQKPIEKEKYKADNLLKSGSVKSAIMVYLSIIHGERDEDVEGTFYGKVYGCLGTAYGRLFLYEQAAKMYEAAFQICEEESMLKAYLYSCYKYMTSEEYKNLLKKSQVYQGIDTWLQEEIETLEEEVSNLHHEDTLENWKHQYRRISTGEL